MLDWSAIDTVLLDMDGTLLDLHFDNHFWQHHLPRRYAEIHGLEPQSARASLIRRFEAEQGSLNWYCLDYWSRELKLDIVALKREVQDRIAERPFAQDFLAALKAQGKRVWLTTNAHRDSLNLKLQHIGIGHWFDRTISAHDIGHPKEDARFWQALQALENFNPARTLFMDDTDRILEAAGQHAGIRYRLNLLQPDSQQALRDRNSLRHPAIHHFDELLPGLNAGTGAART